MSALRPIAVLIVAAVAVASATSVRAEDRIAAERFVAVGFSPGVDGQAVQRERIVRAISRAAEEGARYVLLPEIGTTFDGTREGGVARPASAERVPGDTTRFFGALARRLGIWIALTLREANDTGRGFYLTAVLLDDTGRIRSRQRKVNVPLGSPALRGSPRDPLDSVDTGSGRVGVIVGDDLRTGLPVLAQRGAGTVLVPAAWPSDRREEWLARCAALSGEYGVDLVVASHSAGAADVLAVCTEGRVDRATDAEDDLTLAVDLVPAQPMGWLRVPLGLPSVPEPTYERATTQLVELGRSLFFDPKLSRTGEVSCASCHRPELAFTDGMALGHGVDGLATRRNVPTLLNVAYRAALFWDGRVATLENQAKYPVSGTSEMDFYYLDDAVRYVRSSPEYATRFRAALGVSDVHFEDVARALAAYQRTLLSGDSEFDRFYFRGDEDSIDAAARRGFELFRGKASCSECHRIGEQAALFTDNDFHNTGVGYDVERRRHTDVGVGLADPHAGYFFTPSLRNVARTPPYMHDGSLATLEDVVEFYDRGGTPNPNLDPRIRRLGLSERERADLVQFLRSLTGTQPIEAGPVPAAPARIAAALQLRRADGVAGIGGRVEAQIASAVRARARLVLLPPMPDGGAPPASFFSATAVRNSTWIAARLRSRSADEDAESIVLFDDLGDTVAVQPIVEAQALHRDPAALESFLASTFPVDTPLGRIGLLGGENLQEGVPRLAELGAETILVAAAWDPADPVDWMRRTQRLAAEFGVALLIGNDEAPDAASTLTGAVYPTGAGDARATQEGVVIAALPVRGAPDGGAPLGLPRASYPTTNPPDPRNVTLGRKLFFDTGMSADGTVSCATCHDPGQAFSDARRVAVGIHRRSGERNTPSLLNSAYKRLLLWDGTAGTLEDQVAHALHDWNEMGTTWGDVLAYLEGADDYRRAFDALGASSPVEPAAVARALASFERTLVSANSPFDRYYFGRDRQAIRPAARRGFELFRGKARCSGCHAIQDEYALFSDNRTHNTGVGWHPRFEYLGYGGDGLEGNVATANRFRGQYVTPSLRNVALTAPYMHDGSMPTLEIVVDHYDRGGTANPSLDPRMQPLGLTSAEKQDLIAFLLTLTGEQPAEPAGPPPPSTRIALER